MYAYNCNRFMKDNVDCNCNFLNSSIIKKYNPRCIKEYNLEYFIIEFCKKVTNQSYFTYEIEVNQTGVYLHKITYPRDSISTDNIKHIMKDCTEIINTILLKLTDYKFKVAGMIEGAERNLYIAEKDLQACKLQFDDVIEMGDDD